MKQKLFLLIFFIPLLIAQTTYGQDIHFSQFYETAILRNPALMGIYKEDYKIAFQYRNQWSSIGKGFKTGLLSAEGRFAINNHSNDYISVGVLGYSDKAGSINFRTVGVYPALNYNKSMDDNSNSYLSVGVTAGYVSRSIDVSKMTFDNQYQNGSYNPSNGNGERQMPDPKLNHWDIGAGISFNSSPSENIAYYFGVSSYHFATPKNSFYYSNTSPIRLEARWNVNLGINAVLNETWGVQIYGNYMIQGPFHETIAGGLLKWSKTDYEERYPFALYAGALYRFGDAIVPTLKMDWKGQTFSFSYDLNISTLRTASNLKGGFELTVFTSGMFKNSAEDRRSPKF